MLLTMVDSMLHREITVPLKTKVSQQRSQEPCVTLKHLLEVTSLQEGTEGDEAKCGHPEVAQVLHPSDILLNTNSSLEVISCPLVFMVLLHRATQRTLVTPIKWLAVSKLHGATSSC